MSLKKIKAVALVSTGLDSQLAARVVSDLGIDVQGLHCVFKYDPFIKNIEDKIAEQYDPLSIPVRVVDLTDAFFSVLLEPKHGYGKNINPCIDCKIFIYRYAKKYMQEIGAKFLITGEVAGQRPMTQKTPMLKHLEREGGLEGLVLRPLTAKHLDPTIPEKEGWVDRNQLLDIAGRGRKIQMALVKKYGIASFENPAGGCIFTNPQFGDRAKVLLKQRNIDELTVDDFRLLRLGRHFWIDNRIHVVVGRGEKDNNMLDQFADGRWRFEAAEIAGPVVIAESLESEKDIQLVAGITARYISKKYGPTFIINIRNPNQECYKIEVEALDDQILSKWKI